MRSSRHLSKFLERARQRRLKRRHFLIGAAVLAAFVIGAGYLLNLSPYTRPFSPLDSPFAESQQEPRATSTFYRATVNAVTSENLSDYKATRQTVRITLLDGDDKGRQVTVTRIPYGLDTASQRLPVGSQILVTRASGADANYEYYDRYRVPGGVILLLAMLVLVVVIGKWRGLTGVVGLGISIGVLAAFVVPRVLQGHDAFAACMQGAVIIATVSIFVAHGWSKRTVIAFMSSIVTLGAVSGLTLLALSSIGLTGASGEESEAIRSASHAISLSGILAGGIVIAALGVLDDITTGQTAAVDEIRKASPSFSAVSLYRAGLSVGREHIAALVNTLALAYVGVALPTIIVTALYNNQPLLIILNSEAIMQEVVRTAVASIGLLLAVPLSTALAAYILPRWYARATSRTKAQ